MEVGVEVGGIGVVMHCLTQPIKAEIADKSERLLVPIALPGIYRHRWLAVNIFPVKKCSRYCTSYDFFVT